MCQTTINSILPRTAHLTKSCPPEVHSRSCGEQRRQSEYEYGRTGSFSQCVGRNALWRRHERLTATFSQSSNHLQLLKLCDANQRVSFPKRNPETSMASTRPLDLRPLPRT